MHSRVEDSTTHREGPSQFWWWEVREEGKTILRWWMEKTEFSGMLEATVVRSF